MTRTYDQKFSDVVSMTLQLSFEEAFGYKLLNNSRERRYGHLRESSSEPCLFDKFHWELALQTHLIDCLQYFQNPESGVYQLRAETAFRTIFGNCATVKDWKEYSSFQEFYEDVKKLESALLGIKPSEGNEIWNSDGRIVDYSLLSSSPIVPSLVREQFIPGIGTGLGKRKLDDLLSQPSEMLGFGSNWREIFSIDWEGHIPHGIYLVEDMLFVKKASLACFDNSLDYSPDLLQLYRPNEGGYEVTSWMFW